MQFVSKDLSGQFGHRFMSVKPELPPNFNDRLAALVLDREEEIIEKLAHTPIAGMTRTTTTAWQRYNVLTWNDADVAYLGRIIATGLRLFAATHGLSAPTHLQCWMNVLRKGEGFGLHSHGTADGIAGVYYVTDDGSGSARTCYEVPTPDGIRWAAVQPQPGLVNFFQADLRHYVTPYTGEGTRISIAFDAGWEDAYGHSFVPLPPP